MDCTNFRRHHAAWREGRRASLDRAMAEHAADCPACARFDRALRVGVELLQQAEIEPSPRFMERLERRLAAAESEPREADVFH